MRIGKECIKYINSTVWATLRKSPIHNVGVFAIRDIPKGTKITDNDTYNKKHTLNSLSPDELDMILPEIRKLILDRSMYNTTHSEILPFYSPNCDAILQAWMNHSDRPNTTGTVTLRDIKKNEELTENYLTIAKGAIHSVSSKHFGFLHKNARKTLRHK